MSKLKKIEDRTNWFIEAYEKLEKEGRLPTNTELAKVMGMSSKSTVTNILKRDQNIQPAQLERFKEHFGLGFDESSSVKDEQEPSPMHLLAGLTEGFKAIAETMKSIESKMAQQKDQIDIKEKVQTTDAWTRKMEDVFMIMRTEVRTIYERQELEIEEFRERFEKISPPEKAASKGDRKTVGRNV